MKKRHRNLDLQVVLGNPKIDCDGYGICKIITGHHVPNHFLAEENRLVKTQMSIKKEVAVLTFKKADIPEVVYSKHLATGFFTIETSLRLPQKVEQHIGITPSVLMRGKYRIYQLRQEIIVPIFLKQGEGQLESSPCLTCKGQIITI